MLYQYRKHAITTANKMKIKLSGVVITFNEEDKIKKCIDSLKAVCDEILIVDSFSNDKTKEICISTGVTFVVNKFFGHIEQKNYAKSIAKYDHIISLDADEELDNEAQKSILKVKENWTGNGYYLNRLNNYCGKWIRYGSWYPDIKLRIWDRRAGTWGGINPHDEFMISSSSKPKTLNGYILHYTADSQEQYQKQMIYFSEIAANAYFEKNVTSSIFKILTNPIFRFLRDYILKLGIIDGAAGFQVCKATAYGTYLKYVKLKKLTRSRK